MTNWLPDLKSGDGPLYVRLAGRIEDAIETGALPVGSKLPPQRNLAYDLGVTVGTVSRAYSIVRERGLVSGEVGRGTYVMGRNDNVVRSEADSIVFTPDSNTRIAERHSGGEMIRFDASAAPLVPVASTLERVTSEIYQEHPLQVSDYIRSVSPDWQRAGVEWLSNRHWRPEAANIAPVQGVHSGIIAIIASMTVPGDRIAVEELSYANVPRAAQMIGRRPISVPVDEYGAIPDELDHICAQQHPKLVFLMPAMQNPTLAVMPEQRRQEIAAIARKHNLLIIEDNVYGCLHEDPSPPLAALVPDLTFHISGLSKSVSAGLRAAWIACPPHTSGRVLTATRLLTGGKTFLMTELAARLVNSGAADDISKLVAAEIAERVAMVRETFAGYEFNSYETAPFIWLKLPEPWLSGTFKTAAEREKVLIDSEDEFKTGRSDRTFHRVRIAFSNPVDRDVVRGGLKRLRALLESGAGGYESYD